MDDVATAELPARSSVTAGRDAGRASAVQHVSRWAHHLDVSQLVVAAYGSIMVSTSEHQYFSSDSIAVRNMAHRPEPRTTTQGRQVHHRRSGKLTGLRADQEGGYENWAGEPPDGK
jgi:hypothetical protein